MKIAAVLARKGREFYTVQHDLPLAFAMEIMHRQRIGSVGVIHAEHGRLLGLISQPELLAAFSRFGTESLKQRVSGLMRMSAMTCSCEDDATQVMRAMTRERCRHAVVMNGLGKSAGLVSIGDLVAALLEEARLEAGVLRDIARSRLLAVTA